MRRNVWARLLYNRISHDIAMKMYYEYVVPARYDVMVFIWLVSPGVLGRKRVGLRSTQP